MKHINRNSENNNYHHQSTSPADLVSSPLKDRNIMNLTVLANWS